MFLKSTFPNLTLWKAPLTGWNFNLGIDSTLIINILRNH